MTVNVPEHLFERKPKSMREAEKLILEQRQLSNNHRTGLNFGSFFESIINLFKRRKHK